jgi:hypothetical protein
VPAVYMLLGRDHRLAAAGAAAAGNEA